jgi:Tol biopolymer transport system component
MKKFWFVIFLLVFCLGLWGCSSTESGVLWFEVLRYSANGFLISTTLVRQEGESSKPIAQSTNSFSFFPDGKRMAVSIGGGSEEQSNSDIWVIDADGTDRKNLTGTRMLSELKPQVSPDGEIVAYSLSDPVNPDLCFIHSDGTDRWCLRQNNWLSTYRCNTLDEDQPDGSCLTDDGIIQRSAWGKYIWSPQQEKTGELSLVVESNWDENKPKIYCLWLYNDGLLGNINLVADNAFGPSVNNEGKVAFWGIEENAIFFANLDSSGRTKVVSLPPKTRFVYDIIRWSPDGKKIAYSLWDKDSKTLKIHVMNADGSDDKVVFQGDRASLLSWFPDGTKVLVSESASVDKADNSRLFAVDISSLAAKIKISEINGYYLEVVLK